MAKSDCTQTDYEAMKRSENPIAYIGNVDLDAVCVRIEEVCFSLLSIRQFAIEGIDKENTEKYMIAIQEMSRANVRGLLACVDRLGCGSGMGNFETEFDRA